MSELALRNSTTALVLAALLSATMATAVVAHDAQVIGDVVES